MFRTIGTQIIATIASRLSRAKPPHITARVEEPSGRSGAVTVATRREGDNQIVELGVFWNKKFQSADLVLTVDGERFAAAVSLPPSPGQVLERIAQAIGDKYDVSVKQVAPNVAHLILRARAVD